MERAPFFEDGRNLLSNASSSTHRILLGDFNSHVGKDAKDDLKDAVWETVRVGIMCLGTPTAADSGALLEFLADTKLRLLDSFLPCKQRGTWVHGVSKKWFENEVFLTDVDPIGKRWHSMKAFTTPRFDHRGKLVDLVLYGGPRKHQILKQQQEAKDEEKRIKKQEQSQMGPDAWRLIMGKR